MSPSVTWLATSVSASRSPRKSRSPLRALSSTPSSSLCPSEEVTGVTRSVTSIPSLVRSPASVLPSASSSFPLPEVPVSSVPPSPRRCSPSLVSRIVTLRPLDIPEPLRTSSRLPSTPFARPTDTSPLISGPRPFPSNLTTPVTPNGSRLSPRRSPSLEDPVVTVAVVVVAVDAVAIAVAVVATVVAVVAIVVVVAVVVPPETESFTQTPFRQVASDQSNHIRVH